MIQGDVKATYGSGPPATWKRRLGRPEYDFARGKKGLTFSTNNHGFVLFFLLFTYNFVTHSAPFFPSLLTHTHARTDGLVGGLFFMQLRGLMCLLHATEATTTHSYFHHFFIKLLYLNSCLMCSYYGLSCHSSLQREKCMKLRPPRLLRLQPRRT